jgi:hypothetical protein
VDDPIKRGSEPRLDASSLETVVRVVLAEADAPGALHYLLEAEGFRVIGCASNEGELRRVLEQDLQPDVIVLDTEISATAVLVAREASPSSHVIVIWPEAVQLPTAAVRVVPQLVYEQLGPAIRHAANVHRLHHPIPVEPSEERRSVADEPIPSTDDLDSSLRRAASRVSVTTIALVAAIVLTMGASFALEGWSGLDRAAPPGSDEPRPTAVRSSPTISPTTARQEPEGHEPRPEPEPCAPAGKSDRTTPNTHAARSARQVDDPTCLHPSGGRSNAPAHPSPKHGTGTSNEPAHPNGKDHGNSDEAHTKGNSEATHGGGLEGSNADQSGAHGRP